jgi:ABC-2 type transport system permease protein
VSLRRALVIAWANLVRLVRDRLGLFFIVVLPLIIIVVVGLQFGGAFEPRVGLAAPSGGVLAGELAQALDRSWEVRSYEDADALAGDIRDGRLAAGVLLPERYTDRLLGGESLEVEFMAAPGDAALGRRSVVEAAVADQASLLRAAAFAAEETGASLSAMLDAARTTSGRLPPVAVDVTTVGESLFPTELRGFTLGAQGQLVLFVFLTSLTGASQLILSRKLGVSRRMLSTPTPMPTILLGEALGRFGVAAFQGLFIVAATAIGFGVVWGDPVGAGVLVAAFALVSAGVAMLIGAISDNAEQAGSIGVFAGLGVAALGGSMVPPEVFPPVMQTVSWLTPHRWAIDGLRQLAAGGSLADVATQLGVLLAFGVVLLGLATWRLRVALTR